MNREYAVRILVADGYRDAADSLAAVLTLHSFEARTAYSGAAAMEAIVDWKPDVALLDLDFQDIPGLEIGQWARERCPDIYLVAITGWPNLRHGAMAADTGFDSVQMKPVDFHRLMALWVDREAVISAS